MSSSSVLKSSPRSRALVPAQSICSLRDSLSLLLLFPCVLPRPARIKFSSLSAFKSLDCPHNIDARSSHQFLGSSINVQNTTEPLLILTITGSSKLESTRKSMFQLNVVPMDRGALGKRPSRVGTPRPPTGPQFICSL
jgi:hypothetical protein